MSRWNLIYRTEGDGPPVAIRVRRLLKAALRCYGLRYIGYGPDETPRQNAQDARSQGGMSRKPTEGGRTRQKRRQAPRQAGEGVGGHQSLGRLRRKPCRRLTRFSAKLELFF